MKERFDENGRKLCHAQAVIFQLSKEELDCSSPVFIRRFMYSDFAERMDRGSYLFEASDEKSVLQEIDGKYERSDYGKKKYDEEELYWIGYLYRYWCYVKEMSSKQVYRIVKPEELRKLYFPYHTMDSGQVVERILEAKGMDEKSYTERGVEILRRKLYQ